ncbi:peptide/nickel transport system substrate-binding protein [Streptomyces sp. DvalAA-14]|uniref:ABC transporter family substrate-binding protein n=1 Tax=unclassified Streptomyces TaxID=2593676 RepID=UPI00081B28BE|nr:MULTISPECIES: ABC transporter family substrate-binding protein [unclassified Streptomyces]MYS19185.1 ABC transporter family substrate-binding protein [Streptomyces sp. SID4948]SCD38623.1 peptide/nickel transport system substrate-binding protein [Streptomyces sp. DvalAA-14]
MNRSPLSSPVTGGAQPALPVPAPRRRAVRIAVALAAGAALTLTACSSGSTKAAGTAGTDVAAVARSGVRTGGTLRWAVDAMPRTLNAFQADADSDTATVAGATLPLMFRLDGHGEPKTDPDYVAKAEVSKQSPRQVVTYQLNPRARWSDGKAIGAADFIAQWKALGGRNSAFWTARNAGYDRISGIRQGATAQQVEVTFGTPYADWRSLFSPLYPTGVTATPDAFNEGARTELPVAAGPFALKAVDAKAKTVTLVRNPSWWGKPAKLDRIVLTAVPRAQRPAQLAAGKLDLAEIDPAMLASVRRSPGVAVRKAPDAAYAQLTMNGSSGPLADERVRHAVARAIDRKKIAAAVLKPLGLPAVPLGNHLVLPSQRGYADHSSALGASDLQQAQALLGDAGWQRSSAKTGEKAAGPGRAAANGSLTVVEPNRVVTKGGKQLSLRFVLPADSPTLDDVGGRIARMLSGIGIRTEISKVSGSSYFPDHIASGAFDLALWSWPGSAYPATDDAPIFAKPIPAADGSLTVAQNYSRVGTDQIDQLLTQAGTELDAGAARDLTAKADARIWAAAGSIPLYQRPQVVALRTSVANAGAFGFQTPSYQDLGFRK